MQVKYGFKPVQSYTTRPPRYQGETGHIFATDVDYFYMKDDACAFTMFDGKKYWVTNEQVDKCDTYVIDPAGVDYFIKNYKGKKTPIIVELTARGWKRFARMTERGDSIWDAVRRIIHDRKKFKGFTGQMVVNTDDKSPEEVATTIYNIVSMKEMVEGGLK